MKKGLDTDVEALGLNLGVRKYWGNTDRVRLSAADADLTSPEGEAGLTLSSGGRHHGVQLGYRW